jgi:hypothetical protein
MAFLKPAVLIPVPFLYYGAMDAVTDAELGDMRFDADVFYIDVHMMDANATFDETIVTLEYDDGASGADTVIDAITVAANARLTQVDRDGLTSTAIPAGSRVLLTVNNISTGADIGALIVLWVYPANLS